MEFETLTLKVQENVGTITFNRPEAANAINLRLAQELFAAVTQCEDDSVRAVVVTGSGPFFCAGGDVKEFASHPEDTPRHIKELATWLHAALSRLTRLPAPVIAAVNGTAAGAGFSLAIACDLTLAAQSARFVMAYTGIGLTPDGGSTYFLPRLVGPRRTLELILTNRTLSAQEAEAWGLVSWVVADADLATEAATLASRLAAGPTAAFATSKRLLRLSATESLETQLENETQAIAAAARSQDFGEGLSAFLAKRPPRFSGR
ncbi:MAG: enoyl-CoA hydratase/isomerase family protein [Dehalococcoidia bacterium]